MSTINFLQLRGASLRQLAIFVQFCLLVMLCSMCLMPQVQALGSSQNPQQGSVGLEGTVASPPPTGAATIATPGNGQNISSTPITVSGLCKTGLLVKVFSNNIFIGSAICAGGSYSIQADLFSGQNNLVARVYDSLDQAGPDSNTVTVNFNDAQLIQFGTRVTLTSSYAELGANPGSELVWPISLSGGVGPYAISVDWGDGTAPTLQSESFAGLINIKHTFASAGTYKVTVKATDANGTIAFLQLVGVADGKVTQGTSSNGTNTPVGTSSGSNGSTGSGGLTANGATTKITWITYAPVAVTFPLLFATFWLGRRHELFALHRKLEKSRIDEQIQ